MTQGKVTAAMCWVVALRDWPKASCAFRFCTALLMAHTSPRELVPPKPEKSGIWKTWRWLDTERYRKIQQLELEWPKKIQQLEGSHDSQQSREPKEFKPPMTPFSRTLSSQLSMGKWATKPTSSMWASARQILAQLSNTRNIKKHKTIKCHNKKLPMQMGADIQKFQVALCWHWVMPDGVDGFGDAT